MELRQCLSNVLRLTISSLMLFHMTLGIRWDIPEREAKNKLQNELSKSADTLRLQRDIPHSVKERSLADFTPNVITIDGKLSVTYSGVVNKTTEIVYTFSFQEVKNQTSAFRVHVSSSNSNRNFPVLFVVKQQRSILSWQVPLVLDYTFDYYNVSRTLCPVEQADKKAGAANQTLRVDVSSSSVNHTSFTLAVTKVEDFNIQLGTPHITTVNPSTPEYVLFTFPEGVESVLVKAESEDNQCMIFSIQGVQCPVFDLVRNVEFTGMYQTVSHKGAITVQKKNHPQGSFYIVLVVKPNDFDCYGVETIVPSPGGNDFNQRRKKIVITVEKTISSESYLAAVLGTLAAFFVFYVIAFIITCIYHCSTNDTEGQEPILDQGDRPLTEARPLLANYGTTPSPSTPIVGMDTDVGAASHYGATTDSSGNVRNEDFTRSSNGIPHRIAPPPKDSDDSDLDADIDKLEDVDTEKDVFRMKAYLFVSDLARKDRKYLAKKYKLYHWNLMAIAIFYSLPVIQLVITYQAVLHVTGDQDICYYNFYCTQPLGVLSVFNNVYSNIGYILLGLLFLILVLKRDMMTHKEGNERLNNLCGIPQHYGLFYAMGVALIMEGILSGCYHVCPSYSNFQFDTSFMYMIGWLLMLKIYQNRHPDINAKAHIAYFAIALVLVVAVVGVVFGTMTFWVFYAIAHILVTLLLSTHVYYIGRWKLDAGLFRRLYLWIRSDLFSCTRPLYPDRMILLVIANGVNWTFAIYGCVTQPKDFATYLLAIFIVNSLMYFAFYIIMKLRSGEKILPIPLLFIIMATVVWGFAFYFFAAKLTSWEHTPAMSRNLNKDCLLFGFYDEHDIWHFLSSISLFLSFMMLLTLDDDLVHVPRNKIRVF